MEIKFDHLSLIINEGTHLEKTILNDVSFEIKSQYFEGFEIKKESNSFKRKIGNPFPSSFKSSDVPYCEKDSISQPCTLLNTICSEL